MKMVSVQDRVMALKRIPRVEQKSEAWYEMRRNMITASDFAQALGDGKFGTQKQLIEKKVMPREDEAAASKTNPFFKWGHMFEPVACSIYEKMNGVVIHEFGLLQHPEYPFFGASPDGITDGGVMLEIKCPMRRKLTGDVPNQYYYQIQGQLDVCGLDECDYFECAFELIDDIDEWKGMNEKIRGVIMGKGEETYVYQGPYMPGEALDGVWQGKACKYWVLKEFNLKRVVRDADFVKSKIGELKLIWDKIEHYRGNKEAFEVEVRNAISVSTERLQPPKNKGHEGVTALKGLLATDKYMFLD